jgi:hypothetical protein
MEFTDCEMNLLEYLKIKFEIKSQEENLFTMDEAYLTEQFV